MSHNIEDLKMETVLAGMVTVPQKLQPRISARAPVPLFINNDEQARTIAASEAISAMEENPAPICTWRCDPTSAH